MSSISERVKNRDPLLRFKSESPKFKDALRKKCHQRWKENRWNVVDSNRCLFENPSEKNNLSEIIKSDIQSLYLKHNDNDTDKKLEDLEEIENEIMNDELQWYLSEYNKVLDDEERLAEMLEELNRVICPICKVHEFNIVCDDQRSTVTCPCGLNVLTTLQLPQISERISNCVNEHNNSCNCDPHFTLINENNENHIYLICYICNNFTMLI